MTNLQMLDISNLNESNLRQEILTSLGKIRLNSQEHININKKNEQQHANKETLNTNLTKNDCRNTEKINEPQQKQYKKSFNTSPKSRKQNSDNNEKIMKRLKIKKTLLGKKLPFKDNKFAAGNSVDYIANSNKEEFNLNANLSGNNYFPINNTHELSFKSASFLNSNNNNNTNSYKYNFNTNDLADNPYGLSPGNSRYLNTNNTNLTGIPNTNNFVMNSYNFIKKAKHNSLSIFESNELNNKNSYFANLTSNNTKNNSNFLNGYSEITNNNFLNPNNTNIIKTNKNNVNANNTNISNVNGTTGNLGPSHFSYPYCINIINENEISQIEESSKNNSISKELNNNNNEKNLKSNINSEKSNSDNNINNKNANLNNNLIVKNLTSSRNINFSNFESIENSNKANTHSRNALKKFQNCLSSKDSENNLRSIALINDESTNFCNINSKGSQFNTLDSGKNLQLIHKNSTSKTTSRINSINNNNNTNNNNNNNSNNNNNNVNGNTKKHHKSLSKGVLYNNNKTAFAINNNITNNNNKNSKNTNSISAADKEKSEKNLFSYGILFKDFENKLNKELISSEAAAASSRIHKSNKSSSIGKNGKEINLNLELNKIKEDLKEKKVPKFKNQFKLNKHLIRDFKIGECSNAKQSSKNHLKMTEDYMNFQDSKRNKYRMQSDSSSKQTSNSVFSAEIKSFSPQSQSKDTIEFENSYKKNVLEHKIKKQIFELEKEKRDLDQRLKVFI